MGPLRADGRLRTFGQCLIFPCRTHLPLESRDPLLPAALKSPESTGAQNQARDVAFWLSSPPGNSFRIISVGNNASTSTGIYSRAATRPAGEVRRRAAPVGTQEPLIYVSRSCRL